VPVVSKSNAMKRMTNPPGNNKLLLWAYRNPGLN
jgi:hypothetical protein